MGMAEPMGMIMNKKTGGAILRVNNEPLPLNLISPLEGEMSRSDREGYHGETLFNADWWQVQYPPLTASRPSPSQRGVDLPGIIGETFTL